MCRFHNMDYVKFYIIWTTTPLNGKCVTSAWAEKTHCSAAAMTEPKGRPWSIPWLVHAGSTG